MSALRCRKVSFYLLREMTFVIVVSLRIQTNGQLLESCGSIRTLCSRMIGILLATHEIIGYQTPDHPAYVLTDVVPLLPPFIFPVLFAWLLSLLLRISIFHVSSALHFHLALVCPSPSTCMHIHDNHRPFLSHEFPTPFFVLHLLTLSTHAFIQPGPLFDTRLTSSLAMTMTLSLKTG